MTYKNELKWQALSKFKNGYNNGLTDEQILITWKDLPGTQEEKMALLEECKAYVFLYTAFTSRSVSSRDIAIRLAERYINYSKNNINLVKEELVSFYIEMGKFDKAEELLKELMEEEPKNRRNIEKYIIVLKNTDRIEEALDIAQDATLRYKDNPELFEQHFSILKKLGMTDELIRLARRAQALKLGDDVELRRKRRLRLKKNLAYVGKFKGEAAEKAKATLKTTILREGKISRELKRKAAMRRR